jgi:hypothetical protein
LDRHKAAEVPPPTVQSDALAASDITVTHPVLPLAAAGIWLAPDAIVFGPSNIVLIDSLPVTVCPVGPGTAAGARNDVPSNQSCIGYVAVNRAVAGVAFSFVTRGFAPHPTFSVGDAPLVTSGLQLTCMPTAQVLATVAAQV